MAEKGKPEPTRSRVKRADSIDVSRLVTVGDLMEVIAKDWKESARFRKFYFTDDKLKELKDRAVRALDGVTSHREKCDLLVSLAKKLKPNLNIDVEELEQQRYTFAVNSKEAAAVIEAAILELYSSIDCIVQVLHAIYGRKSRKFPESTRKFFEGVEQISGEFPEELKLVVQGVSWYKELLYIRDDLTHLDTGLVHLDERDGPVRYIHPGIQEKGKPFVREDMFAWLTDMIEKVGQFHDEIFRYLNSTLMDKPLS